MYISIKLSPVKALMGHDLPSQGLLYWSQPDRDITGRPLLRDHISALIAISDAAYKF